MFLKIETLRTLQVSNVDDYLLTWLEAFLIDRKAAGVANGTLRFYRQKTKTFRLKYIFLAGKIAGTERRVVMKLPKEYPYQGVYKYSLA